MCLLVYVEALDCPETDAECMSVCLVGSVAMARAPVSFACTCMHDFCEKPLRSCKPGFLRYSLLLTVYHAVSSSHISLPTLHVSDFLDF